MDNKKSNENNLFGIIEIPKEEELKVDIVYVRQQIDEYMRKNRE